MVKNKKIIYCSRSEGMTKLSDFKLVEEDIPELKDGEIKTEALFVSADPYMRMLTPTLPLNSVMFGSQVARVIESKHKNYAVGSIVAGELGWQTHFCGNPEEVALPFYGKIAVRILSDFKGLSYSHALGALGMPGVTAHFGLLNILAPKPGETVVVNGAAGAVGSLVGQIAKIKGCRVIGFAGSDDKVKWLTEELKFDKGYNYKKIEIKEALADGAPAGVDCFFDNVGGPMSISVIDKMNLQGRIAVCGAISTYNKEGKDPATVSFNTLLKKELKVQGFIISRYVDMFPGAIKDIATWISEDKLKAREYIFDGFEKLPEALISLFKGDNTGKVIVKI